MIEVGQTVRRRRGTLKFRVQEIDRLGCYEKDPLVELVPADESWSRSSRYERMSNLVDVREDQPEEFPAA